MNNEVSEWED